MRRFLAPVFLSLFSLILSLGFIEVGVRYFLSHRPAPVSVNDRPKAHYFQERAKTNRDYLYSPEKPENTFRIVTIGDSFTFGFGNLLDDSYPKRLERILNLNASQPKVEVLNFGSPGYSTKMEVKLVKKAIEEFHPDLIILQVTLNDPEIRPYLAPRGVLNNKVGANATQEGIYRHWKTLALVASRIKNTESYTDYISYYQNLFTDPETSESFKGALTDIHTLCEQSKVPLVAMVFPMLSFKFDESAYPFMRAHQIIHQMLSELGIPYLDLFESFRGLDPIRMQAVPAGLPDADPHPSELAHRIATESLFSWLAKGNHLPKEVQPKCRSRKRVGPSKIRCAQ